MLKIKIKQYLDLITKIDKETGSMIKFIDDIKLKILEKSGENVKDFGNKKLDKIIWIKLEALLSICLRQENQRKPSY